MTDIRANLVDVQLDEVGDVAPESVPPQDEPDPIEEEAARPQATPPSNRAPRPRWSWSRPPARWMWIRPCKPW
jgi:hypothetical protein